MGALLAYVILKGLESTVVRGLQIHGASHPVAGINPISACNLFFFALLAVGVSLVVADRTTLRRQLPQLQPRHWRLLAVDMLAGNVAGPLGGYLAIEHLAVIEKTLVFTLVLPVSALLSRLWLDEPLPRRFVVTTTVIALGLVLSSQGTATSVAVDWPMGLFWALVGVAGFSCSAVTARQLGHERLGIGCSTGMPSLVAACLFLFAGILLFGPEHFMHLQLWWVAGVIGLYAFTIVLGSEWSLRLCYRRFSVAKVGTVGSLTIVVSVFSAALVLAEALDPMVLLGTALVLIGVILAIRSMPAEDSARISTSGATTLTPK